MPTAYRPAHPQIGDTIGFAQTGCGSSGSSPSECSPGSLVMERKMLRGIKQRAERVASATPEHSGT